MQHALRHSHNPGRTFRSASIGRTGLMPRTFARPCGTSLIEVVTAMSIAGVMLLAALQVLHTALKTERGAIRGIVFSTSITRLSRTFREDVHAAQSVTIAKDANTQAETLTLTLADGGSIRYEPVRRGLSRIAQGADDQEQREFFPLAETSTVRMQRLADPDRVLVVVSFPRHPAEAAVQAKNDTSIASTDRYIPMEAALARHHRFDRATP